MTRSFYDMTKAECAALADTIESLVRLNYYAAAASDAGWKITFTVNNEGPAVNVKVERVEGWPTPQTEAAE